MITPPPSRPVAPIPIWWVLWLAMTAGLIVQCFVLTQNPAAASGTLNYIALAPLVISLIIRFAVLPRMKTKQKAFPLFVVGLATAEACGLFGLILGGPHRDWFFAAGLVLLLIYIPFFARNYDGGGKPNPFQQS